MVVAAKMGRRLKPLDTSVLKMRTWPGDLDINFHMNNGRYLTLMDLGRFNLTIRSGQGGLMIKKTLATPGRRRPDPLRRFPGPDIS